MFNKKYTLLCAKLDRQSQGGGMILIDENKAKIMNEKGYGIFRTVNSFNGSRIKGCLRYINGWYVEIDRGEKIDQLKKIQASPLEPSFVVETKRGYQIIFGAKDASLERYFEINKYGLVPFFDGDPNACDLCRVLREPGYYHLKDPDHPFLVKAAHQSDASYTEREIITAFPLRKPPDKREKFGKLDQPSKIPKIKVSNEDALLRLSGMPEVKGENFTFFLNNNGTKQIVVNNRPTSCWIDRKGFIGSSDGGGPTVAQWLQWYGHDLQTIRAVLKKYQII